MFEKAGSENNTSFKTLAGHAEFCAAYDRELASWPLAVEQLVVLGDFGITHVLKFGNPMAKPLVLLHCLCGNSTLWRNVAAELGAEFCVYAADTMGDLGKSRLTRVPSSEADIAAWFVGLLDGLGLGSVCVAGLSYGGYQAMVTAPRAGGRIERLVLLAPPGIDKIRLQFFGLVFNIMFRPSERTTEQFITLCSVQPQNWSETLLELIRIGFRNGQGRLKLMPRRHRAAELRAIAQPTLLLLGDREFIYDHKKVLANLARTVPHWKTALIPGSGHFLPVDAPGPTAQAIIEFCRAGASS